MSIRGTAIRFGAFALVSVLAAVVVVNTLANPLEGRTRTYHAVFTDVEGVYAGSEVRVAGVRVGKVTDVALEEGQAVVTFDVLNEQRVPGHTNVAVRYADLLGGRYLAIDPGDRGGGELEADSTIPVERTKPALELTALMNGFRPLFDAIDPGQANQLASELVAVFQGEAGTITSLLNRVISVTSDLAGRDQVIGELLTNLNSVLGTMSEHRQDLRVLVGELGQLTSSVADNREQIGAALDSGGALAHSLHGTLGQITPRLSQDIDTIRTVTGSVANNQEQLDGALRGAPDMLTRLNRTLDYGTWVNIYVCNLKLSVAGQQVDLGAGPHSEVCR